MNENSFSGNITYLATDLDLSHESNKKRRVSSGTETASTNILYAGFQCCVFNGAVASGPLYQWLYRTASGGHVTGANDKDVGTDGFHSASEFRDARNATNISNSLTLLRSALPPASPMAATPTGTTDARLYGLMLDNLRIGLHVTATGTA